MTSPQPAPQIIEEFRDREGESFVYGFGKIHPCCSFLFDTEDVSDSRLFSINQDDEFFEGHIESFYVEDYSDDYPYSNCLPHFFHAAAEAHMKRVSVHKYKCLFCGKIMDKPSIIDHIISQHAEPLRRYLEPHMPFINKDDKAFHGIFTKCQFESLITPPSKPYQLNRGQSGNIVAPIISEHDEFDDSDNTGDQSDVEGLQKYCDPLFYPGQYRVHFHDCCIAPLTKFSRDHRPINQIKSGQSATEDNDMITEDFNKKEYILKQVDQLYMPVIERQTKLQQLLQQKQQQQPTSQTIQQQESADFQGKNKSPAGKGQSKTNQSSTTANVNSIESKMLAIELAEKEEKNKMKQLEQQKAEEMKPKSIPYLSTIPSNLIDDVINSITDKYIGEYVESTTLVLVKPQLTAAKKAHSKRMRDEKFQRQKAEEKKRIEALKERRMETITKISKQVAAPLIKSFIRQEINHIFEEEVKKHEMQKQVAKKPLLKKSHNGLPDPVVVSGLTSQKHLSLSFLSDLFSNLNFVLDEDKKPKIRFRVRYQRYEILLYLTSEQEVMKALAMSPLQVEWAQAVLEIDTELPPEGCWSTYTGQTILEMTSAKNVEGIHNGGGLLAYKQMSPYCDLTQVISQTTSQNQQTNSPTKSNKPSK